jgi:serine/threonine protein kinase
MGQMLTNQAANQAVAMCNNVLKYDWPRYRYSKTLGAGAFGEVYLVHDTKTTGRVYALKKIKCGSNDDLNNVTQELKSVSKFNHPNIMALYDTRCKQKEDFWAEVYMIFEYCSGGTLSDRLQKPSTKALDIKWMRQLANAVAYIHALALVHRDLKPDNILLSATDNIKIGDFGLARDFVAAKRENETWANYYMSAACGTLFYMAPEVFEGHYTEKGDVFALGVLLYAIEERKCFEINGMKCYGIFILLPDEDRAPLGLQMYNDKTGLKVPFTKCSPKLAQIIGSTLLFDHNNRADAATIHGKLKEYVESS